MECPRFSQVAEPCSRTECPEKDYCDALNARMAKLILDLNSVNNIIFAAGAPLGSEKYFEIREITCKYSNRSIR
jgi:hypothetical protein